jgi:hypothetical protein
MKKGGVSVYTSTPQASQAGVGAHVLTQGAAMRLLLAVDPGTK